MDGVVAAWRRWFGPPVRDAILAVVVTAILLVGSYGEGSPSSPEAHPSTDRIQFQGHAAPQPGAALILVAVACLALLWRRRAPVAVLGVSVAAATSTRCSATSTAPSWWPRSSPCTRWPAR